MVMKNAYSKFKSGAASFYVVAFSTLILMVIAASFATAIIAELTRSSNDDLAQSAYDSAMAGVEDAKLAFANYRTCLTVPGVKGDKLNNSDADIGCDDIVYWVSHPDGDGDVYDGCNMVAHVLGRIGKRDEENDVDLSSGVSVNEGDPDSDMDQAYTCTKIKTRTNDYRATITPLNPYKIVKVSFADDVRANDIHSVKLSWHSATKDNSLDNYANEPEAFQAQARFISAIPTKALPTPATLAVQLLQSSTSDGNLKILTEKSTFSQVESGKTDRATVYLVPTHNSDLARRSNDLNETALSRGIFNADSKNVVNATDFASTNDHAKDYPLITYCSTDAGEEFACSVIMKLPNLINGENRSENSFMFIINMPYEGPDTDFALEFYKEENPTSSSKPVELDNTQVVIDSTGRANDLYSRVEVRLEPEIDNFEYPFYAVQANDVQKALIVTSEHGDYSGYYGEGGIDPNP